MSDTKGQFDRARLARCILRIAPDWSDASIAGEVGLSEGEVRRLRDELITPEAVIRERG